MAISLTSFKSQYDNKPKQIDFSGWDHFEKFLRELTKRPLKGKRHAELISPAVYVPGTTRANKNVLGWAGWAAVDVDDHKITGNLENELVKRYGVWDYVCYSTASSTSDHPKFRLVFRLDRYLEKDHIKHFWFALNSELGNLGDRQCKDLSRMYYVPADYSGANNFFYTNKGNALDTQALMNKWPFSDKKAGKSFMDRLPDNLQQQVVEYRKGQMEKKNYSWTGYRDCPFVNKNLVKEYTSIAHIDNSGRYAMIYKIMVSTATNAIKREYPITVDELVDLIKDLDRSTSNRYENRPLDVEADRALEYAYKNA